MTSLLTHWKLILGLILGGLLIVLWLLWRGQVAEVGRLESINTELSEQVKQVEEDKANLQATLESNSRISEQDEVDRKKLSEQVVQLNSSISKLTKEKNVLKKQVGSNANLCQDGSDLELSDELRSMLNDARAKANSSGAASSKSNQ